MCPCKDGRIGAFVTVFWLYWVYQLGGVASVLALLRAGDSLAIGGAVVAVGGVLLLLNGISEALSHDDNFEGASFLWSVSVIGLSIYALLHHWYIDAASVHVSRALWFSWMASNAFNVWLQLRGVVGRRVPVEPDIQERQAPLPLRQRTLRRFRLSSRSGNAEWDEATEWYGNDHQSSPPPQFFPAPAHIAPVIEHDGAAPQIGYLDGNGNFIPVQLPPGQKVPVSRRLR
jgi:hypothetical protein